MSTPFYTPLASVLPSFEGATLLIPAVSIGSVPQLAVDLLLHSADLGLAKVGRIDPSFCFPFAGPSDARNAAADDITTALEGKLSHTLSVVSRAVGLTLWFRSVCQRGGVGGDPAACARVQVARHRVHHRTDKVDLASRLQADAVDLVHRCSRTHRCRIRNAHPLHPPRKPANTPHEGPRHVSRLRTSWRNDSRHSRLAFDPKTPSTRCGTQSRHAALLCGRRRYTTRCKLACNHPPLAPFPPLICTAARTRFMVSPLWCTTQLISLHLEPFLNQNSIRLYTCVCARA